MRERKRPVGTVEAGLLTALAIIFTLLGTYVPMLGFFSVIVAVPLALIGIRHNYKVLVPAVIAASVLSFLVGGVLTAINVGLMAGISALFITYCFKKQLQVSHMVVGLSIVSIIVTAMSFQLLMLITDINFFEVLEASMKESAELLKSFPMEGDQYDAIIKNMDLVVETMRMTIPSMMVFMGAIYAFVNIITLRFIMSRLKMNFISSKPFNEFMFPRSVLIGTTLIMILSYLAGIMGIVDLSILFINVILIVAFVFSIQGIAVLDYGFGKRNIPIALRIIIIGVLYFLFNGQIFFGIIGWFDVIFNFRKLELHDHMR